MDIQFYIPGLTCIIIALAIMFRLLHYAEFYTPSYFFWIGIIISFSGLISLIHPLSFLFIHNRLIAGFVVLGGFTISILSLLWPVKINHSQTDQKIDEILPDFAFSEYHEVNIKASSEKVKQTLKNTGVQDIPSVHFLMKIRGIADNKDMSDKVSNNPAGSDTFSTPDFNFFMVDPTEYISVMIIKSSIMSGSTNKISAPPEISTLQQFISFDSPGYVKVAINFRFISHDNKETVLTTETRIQGINRRDNRIFGCYWRIIYPGSAIIRRVWLDTVNKRTIKSENIAG